MASRLTKNISRLRDHVYPWHTPLTDHAPCHAGPVARPVPCPAHVACELSWSQQRGRVVGTRSRVPVLGRPFRRAGRCPPRAGSMAWLGSASAPLQVATWRLEHSRNAVSSSMLRSYDGYGGPTSPRGPSKGCSGCRSGSGRGTIGAWMGRS